MSQYISAKPGEWDGEERPLFLAPMAGVTDLPFRLLAKECGADFTITEFTNSTALTREAARSWSRMETCEEEDPFIPQIFGGVAEDMARAAEMLSSNADIIDLNFGCPAPKVTKICAGQPKFKSIILPLRKPVTSMKYSILFQSNRFCLVLRIF